MTDTVKYINHPTDTYYSAFLIKIQLKRKKLSEKRAWRKSVNLAIFDIFCGMPIILSVLSGIYDILISKEKREGTFMTELSEEILQSWQVRKTKEQKTAFIDRMKREFPELQVETEKKGKVRNLVLGEVETAKTVFTAHYDTCARMLVPNLITPRNLPVYILYNIAVCVPFLLLLFAVMWGMEQICPIRAVNVLVAYCAFMAALFFALMGGKPNPHTANDNTSGVIALIEIYNAMTEQERRSCAFVFFDLEELGMVGSGAFAKHHREEMKNRLVFNLDCVSDGDHMLFVINKKAGAKYRDVLMKAFPDSQKITCHFCRSATTVYPSDQTSFPVSLAAASMRKNRFAGLYMNRIHTPKDTVFEEENIRFLRDGARRFLQLLP